MLMIVHISSYTTCLYYSFATMSVETRPWVSDSGQMYVVGSMGKVS